MEEYDSTIDWRQAFIRKSVIITLELENRLQVHPQALTIKRTLVRYFPYLDGILVVDLRIVYWLRRNGDYIYLFRLPSGYKVVGVYDERIWLESVDDIILYDVSTRNRQIVQHAIYGLMGINHDKAYCILGRKLYLYYFNGVIFEQVHKIYLDDDKNADVILNREFYTVFDRGAVTILDREEVRYSLRVGRLLAIKGYYMAVKDILGKIGDAVVDLKRGKVTLLNNYSFLTFNSQGVIVANRDNKELLISNDDRSMQRFKNWDVLNSRPDGNERAFFSADETALFIVNQIGDDLDRIIILKN